MPRRNPAPPPPFNSTWQQLLAWAQRTYAPGTVVRIDSWDDWSVGQMADPSSRDTRVTVPAGTRGTVVGVARSGYGVVIWIRVHDARSYIHALPDKLDREMTDEMWERLDASGQDVVSKYLGQDSLSQIVPLDDHWAQASKPMSRHALPSSQKRTSRRLRPNVVPPQPDDHQDLIQWARRTYAPGTRVRLKRPMTAFGNDDEVMVPAGSIGRVDSIEQYSGMSRIVGTVSTPLFTSSASVMWSKLCGPEYLSHYFEPIDDNWGSLTVPAKRQSPPPQSGWARQLRASRRIKPNPAPPMPSGGRAMESWILRTFQVGTYVRFTGYIIDMHAPAVPKGARGMVVGHRIDIDAFGDVNVAGVVVAIMDARFEDGRQIDALVGRAITVYGKEYGRPFEPFPLEPLVDHWASSPGPLKHHHLPKSQRTSRRMKPNPYLHATRGDLAKQILEERKLRAFPSRKYEGRPAVFAGDARSPTMADAAMKWADVKHSFHFGAHPEEENVLIEFDARPPDDRRGPTGMPSADGDEAVWFDDVDLVNPRVVRRRKGEMVWNGRRTSRRRTSRRTR